MESFKDGPRFRERDHHDHESLRTMIFPADGRAALSNSGREQGKERALVEVGARVFLLLSAMINTANKTRIVAAAKDCL